MNKTKQNKTETHQKIERIKERKKSKIIFYKFDQNLIIPSLGQRFLAYIIDISSPVIIYYSTVIYKSFRPIPFHKTLDLWLLLLSSIYYFLYDCIMIDGKYRSIGKYMMGIEIYDLSKKQPINFSQSLLRSFFEVFFMIIDPLYMILSDGNRGLSDLIGNTILIKTPKSVDPFPF